MARRFLPCLLLLLAAFVTSAQPTSLRADGTDADAPLSPAQSQSLSDYKARIAEALGATFTDQPGQIEAATTAIADTIGGMARAQTSRISPDFGSVPVAPHVVHEPNVSHDGKQITFIYDGDVWIMPTTGGVARRLTVTVGTESSPIFSPDGKWIAFTSRRFGSGNLFVMPAVGGPARRLTFDNATDFARGWLPDGSGVLFNSSRNDQSHDVWAIRLEGGQPWPITTSGFREHKFWPALSPNGRHLVYVRGGGTTSWQRRGYNGSANNDLWIADFDGVLASNHRQLTTARAHETMPVWLDDDTILYVSYVGKDDTSDRVGRIEAISPTGQKLDASRFSRCSDVVEPSIGGGKLVYVTGAYGGWNLYVTDTATGAVGMPAIKILTDNREQDITVNTTSTVDEYAVSPDQKLVAFIAHHDVWVMLGDETSPARQLTDTVARESGLVWAPDSRRVIFTSSRGALPQLFMLDVTTGAERQLTDEPGGASRAMLLPGSKTLLYCRNENEIAALAIPDNDQEEINHGTVSIKGDFHGANRSSGSLFDVTPDGKWITFVDSDSDGKPQIFVANIESGETRKVTAHFGGSFQPSFGLCGKRLFYVTRETGDGDVYLIELTHQPMTFAEDKLDELLTPPDRVTKDEAAPARRSSGRETPTTEIIWEGLEDRVRRVTTTSGSESNPLGLEDGKTVLFFAGGNIRSVVAEAHKPNGTPRDITSGTPAKSQISLSPDLKTMWFLEGGVVQKGKPTGGAASARRVTVRQVRDRAAIRHEAFRECVWLMGNYFYDAGMHEVDWKRVSDRYLKALDASGTNEEWGGLMNQLLGELNSSHQGFTAADSRSDGLSESTARLGLIFDPRELSNGRYKITEVLKGGPCDPSVAEVSAGEYLVGLNGKLFEPGNNLSRELTGMFGRKVVLHLTDEAGSKSPREVAVRATSTGAESALFYQRWVDGRRAMVHELSAGRLGYVHIAGMNQAGVDHFKHHLANDLQGKEGAVIDVRFNGGGNTAVVLLEILIKRDWLRRTNRQGTRDVSENIYRSVAWENPAILLTNQNSFSNAEIMSEGFQRLGIGQVVGTETGGGVIGTSSATLIDGSRIRMPMSGAFTVEGENLENIGRRPTINVEITPEDQIAGRDPQLETAVKVILAECDEAKAKQRR
jgi:tricorn protease